MAEEDEGDNGTRTIKKVVHVGMSEAEVDKKILKLQDDLHALHAGDTKEREELKAEVAELRDYKEKQEKAQAERDKVGGDKSTLVLPPTDIPPQQPAPPPTPENQLGPEGGTRKRRMGWW